MSYYIAFIYCRSLVGSIGVGRVVWMVHELPIPEILIKMTRKNKDSDWRKYKKRCFEVVGMLLNVASQPPSSPPWNRE